MLIDYVIPVLDYLGIAVFVVSGGLLAAKLKMDITSFIFLGMAAGLGGGTLRDMLLGRTPVFWVADPDYFLLCVVVASATFFVVPWLEKASKLLVWFDGLGMCLFAVIGTKVALHAGTSNEIALLMGVMTASFGGLIRDMMAQVPSILFQKNIYMTAALAGSVSYIGLIQYSTVDEPYAMVISIIVAFILRALAIIYNLRLPSYKWIDKS